MTKKGVFQFFERPATYRIVIWALTFFGVTLSPEQAEAISAAGVAVAVALELLFREKPRNPELRTRESDQLPVELPARALPDSVESIPPRTGFESQ